MHEISVFHRELFFSFAAHDNGGRACADVGSNNICNVLQRMNGPTVHVFSLLVRIHLVIMYKDVAVVLGIDEEDIFHDAG